MAEEMTYRKINFRSELIVPVQYRTLKLTAELQADFVVGDLVVVELKAANEMAPIFQAQLTTYMKLLKKHRGLLINFNVENISRNATSIVTPEFAILAEE